MKRIRLTYAILLVLISSVRLHGQNIDVLLSGSYHDSSFYHIEKINENEYWVCGEYGILKKLDTLGRIENLSLRTQGGHLLKILRWKDYVFLSSDDGRLFRYDLPSKTWKTRSFRNYRNKCFYDFTINDRGIITICGGRRKIAKGKKRLPFGFIAISDTGLSEPHTIWQALFKFPFKLTNKNGLSEAWVFGGIRSHRIVQTGEKTWEKRYPAIKGLVHGCSLGADTLYFCGSKNFRYKKIGMIGILEPYTEIKYLYGTGCIWDFRKWGNGWVALSRSGEISMVHSGLTLWNPIRLPDAYSLYDAISFGNNKLLVVGHGKRMYLLRFSPK